MNGAELRWISDVEREREGLAVKSDDKHGRLRCSD